MNDSIAFDDHDGIGHQRSSGAVPDCSTREDGRHYTTPCSCRSRIAANSPCSIVNRQLSVSTPGPGHLESSPLRVQPSTLELLERARFALLTLLSYTTLDTKLTAI